MRRLAPNEVGEVYLGGASVTRGYHGRAALTAQRFLPDPYGPPGSLYRTGDLGRVEGDGELRLLGRIDHQVKLHGRRIEPGEIEAAMTAHPHVSLAAAVPAGAGAAATLTGFFTGAEADAEELRGFLTQRLPAALVPSRLVALDTLPLSPNGKIDRNALADIAARQDLAAVPLEHPNTPTPSCAPSSTPRRTSWAEHLSPRTRTSSTRAATPCTRPGSWPSCARPWTRRSASARSSNTRPRPSWPTHCASRSTTPRTVGRGAPRKASCPPPSTVCGCWRRSPRPPPSTPSLSPSISRAPLDTEALGWAVDAVVRRHDSLRSCFPDRDGTPVRAEVLSRGVAADPRTAGAGRRPGRGGTAGGSRRDGRSRPGGRASVPAGTGAARRRGVPAGDRGPPHRGGRLVDRGAAGGHRRALPGPDGRGSRTRASGRQLPALRGHRAPQRARRRHRPGSGVLHHRVARHPRGGDPAPGPAPARTTHRARRDPSGQRSDRAGPTPFVGSPPRTAQRRSWSCSPV